MYNFFCIIKQYQLSLLLSLSVLFFIGCGASEQISELSEELQLSREATESKTRELADAKNELDELVRKLKLSDEIERTLFETKVELEFVKKELKAAKAMITEQQEQKENAESAKEAKRVAAIEFINKQNNSVKFGKYDREKGMAQQDFRLHFDTESESLIVKKSKGSLWLTSLNFGGSYIQETRMPIRSISPVINVTNDGGILESYGKGTTHLYMSLDSNNAERRELGVDFDKNDSSTIAIEKAYLHNWNKDDSVNQIKLKEFEIVEDLNVGFVGSSEQIKSIKKALIDLLDTYGVKVLY